MQLFYYLNLFTFEHGFCSLVTFHLQPNILQLKYHLLSFGSHLCLLGTEEHLCVFPFHQSVAAYLRGVFECISQL